MSMHGCCNPKYSAISNNVVPCLIVAIGLRLGSDSNYTARPRDPLIKSTLRDGIFQLRKENPVEKDT